MTAFVLQLPDIEVVLEYCHRRYRLQDIRGYFLGISLGVWLTIFQIPPHLSINDCENTPD